MLSEVIMNKHYLSYIICCILSIPYFSACEEELLDKEDSNQLTQETTKQDTDTNRQGNKERNNKDNTNENPSREIEYCKDTLFCKGDPASNDSGSGDQDTDNDSNSQNDQEIIPQSDAPDGAMVLKVRFHLMQGKAWQHPLGVSMNAWVSSSNVTQSILPEVNNIWSDTNVYFEVESIVQESINEYSGYEGDIDFIVNTERDEEGRSDPNRLPLLYDLMDPAYRSSNSELNTELLHIYIFPFIGNTSQGNAMSGYDYHTVVSCWTNKFNGGDKPEKTLLTESHSDFDRGSISRTIAHEIGHVLGLSHSCNDCLMDGSGYELLDEQISTVESKAANRLD